MMLRRGQLRPPRRVSTPRSTSSCTSVWSRDSNAMRAARGRGRCGCRRTRRRHNRRRRPASTASVVPIMRAAFGGNAQPAWHCASTTRASHWASSSAAEPGAAIRPSASTSVELANCPASWPPMPSATAQRPAGVGEIRILVLAAQLAGMGRGSRSKAAGRDHGARSRPGQAARALKSPVSIPVKMKGSGMPPLAPAPWPESPRRPPSTRRSRPHRRRRGRPSGPR